MPGLEDLRWLVKHRSEVQSFLYDLYAFADSNPPFPDGTQEAVFQLLVGTGFSLWRAAFLAESLRSLPEVEKHSRDFLLLLIKDNAVGYYQEQKTGAWMVGLPKQRLLSPPTRQRDPVSQHRVNQKS